MFLKNMKKDKIIFYNGVFFSDTPSLNFQNCLAIADGKIVATDLDNAQKILGEDAQKIDLNGKFVMPPFNDAHIHIWKVGNLMTYMLDLRGVRSLAEMQEKIADFAANNPGNEWILARGFNEALFDDGKMPTRYDLDAAVSDRPMQVIRTCAHIAVLNSKACAISGIQKGVTVPKGGEIRLDAAGVPTGVISETALGLAQKNMPEYTPPQYRRMILAAQEAFLKAGIAYATDPAVHPELLAVYQEMDKNGELKICINAIPILVPDGADKPLPMPTPYKSANLVVDTVKFFSDGGLSGKTAALKKPYKNTEEYGVLRLNSTFFKDLATKAQAAGFRMATHAIGDAAIELVLDVYEYLAKNNPLHLEHRIEHLGLPDAIHLEKMQKLRVHCVTQPIFITELGKNFRNYLDDFYLDNVYPYRAVLEAGVNLTFSSDAPVVKDFNPLSGIKAAVTRCDNTGTVIGEAQKISVLEALKAYTIGAAAAQNTRDTQGVLAVGRDADFIILDKNPLNFEENGSEIGNIKVLQTWIKGVAEY